MLTREMRQTVHREQFSAYSLMKIDLKEIVQSKGFSSLKTWTKVWGEPHMEDLLFLVIDDICSYLNIGKNMGEIQIRQTVKLIIQQFPDLSMEDFKVWSNQFKSGHYGKLYDSVDGVLLLSSIELYEKERMKAIEDNHDNIKNSVPELNVSNPIFKVLSEVSKKPDAKPLSWRIIDPLPPREPTEFDNRINFILKMFDRIHRGNPVRLPSGQPTGIKMIYVNSKPVDQNKFMDIMLMKDSK